MIDPRGGRTCARCGSGRLWAFLPVEDDGIRLCVEHEQVVADIPGWTVLDDDEP